MEEIRKPFFRLQLAGIAVTANADGRKKGKRGAKMQHFKVMVYGYNKSKVRRFEMNLGGLCKAMEYVENQTLFIDAKSKKVRVEKIVIMGKGC